MIDSDKRHRRPTVKQLQVRHIARAFGLTPSRAKLVADLNYGEVGNG